MLSDLLASFRTSISPHLRALGYLDEALDMRRRSRLNSVAWQPHLDRTRRFVLSSAGKCGKRGTIVILGSGLLLDVPLEQLSAMFGSVLLKDVVCLPEVRRRIKQYSNLRFIEHDVTGTAERLSRSTQQGIQQLPETCPPLADSEGADLVVSLNILSQLWVVPRRFIGKKLQQIDPVRVDEWCGKIVTAHFAWLRSLPCDVCLVADFEAVKRDPAGSIVSRASTVYGLELPEPDDQWTWSIAPIGRQNPHGSKELTVGAWFIQQRT